MFRRGAAHMHIHLLSAQFGANEERRRLIALVWASDFPQSRQTMRLSSREAALSTEGRGEWRLSQKDGRHGTSAVLLRNTLQAHLMS